MSTDLLFGIDLGGTKIEGVVLQRGDLENPLARIRIPTESSYGYQHILSRITELVQRLEEEVEQRAESIGIGTPGCIDPVSQLMKNCNTTSLNGMPLKGDLERILKKRVELANDANCFALAEARLGAGKNFSVVFGVIMGTGVGGGIVLNKKVHHGAQGLGGEWGHNVLIQDGELCYCGRKGCVETCISGPALERYYFSLTEKKISLAQIIAEADSNSHKVIDYLCVHFGKALAVVINIIDPDVVILGGGLSNIPDLYVRGVQEVEKYVFNNKLHTKIIKNELGDSAGVFGAAFLVE